MSRQASNKCEACAAPRWRHRKPETAFPVIDYARLSTDPPTPMEFKLCRKFRKRLPDPLYPFKTQAEYDAAMATPPEKIGEVVLKALAPPDAFAPEPITGGE